MLKYVFFIAILFSEGCTTSPTGRSQLNLVSEDQMDKMGEQSFQALKKKNKLSSDKNQFNRIRCITDRLLVAMNENPKKWEVEVFKDSSPNAFALPGKKMGIHTGMIDLAKNNAQIAAVIGHEIGHVLSNHGAERVSQNMASQGLLAVGAIALGTSTTKDQALLAALGVGAQFGVLLPFSRKHETEADELGLRYMAKAGFDPKEAAELWKLMQKKGGANTPEFLSSHPSNESRIKNLSKLSKNYMSDYTNANKSPKCD